MLRAVYLTRGTEASPSVVDIVSQTPVSGGESPTVTNSDYAAAFSRLESYKYKGIALVRSKHQFRICCVRILKMQKQKAEKESELSGLQQMLILLSVFQMQRARMIGVLCILEAVILTAKQRLKE